MSIGREADHDEVIDNSLLDTRKKAQTYFSRSEIFGISALIIVLIAIMIWYSTSTIINKKTVPVFVEIGSLYQSSGKAEDAVRVFDEARKTGTNDPVLLGRIGENYRLLRQYDKAAYVVKKALKKDPDNPTYLLSYARSIGSSGKCEQAIPIYKDLIDSDLESATYSFGLVGCYIALKEYDNAFTELERLEAINPSNLQVFLTRGDIYRAQEDWGAAIDQYFRALQINPNLYTTRIYIGQIYSRQREFNAARIQFEAASSVNQDQPDPYYFMAETYVAQGNFTQAIPLYNKAIEVATQHIPSILGLGKSYAAIGDCQTAVPFFRKILDVSPDNEDAHQGIHNCFNPP